MSTTAAEKAALRRTVREELSRWTPRALTGSDDALFARFLALPELAGADTVLLYHGMGTEPDTSRLIAPLLAEGKTVALPRCLPSGGMEARIIREDSVLIRHRWGMLEPGEDCPPLDKDRVELLLVPGMCFDKKCYRLGRGGGYYDRYLAGFRGCSVGLCRGALLRTALPMEPHDRPVDLVLTETETLHRACPGGGQGKAGP